MEGLVAMGVMASLVRKLSELLKDDYKLHKEVKKDVESLSIQMKIIEAHLRKVAEVTRDQRDEQVQLWANDVKEMSYNIENAVDQILAGVKGTVPTLSLNMVKRPLEKMARRLTKYKARHKMTKAIKSIKKQVEDVAAKEHMPFLSEKGSTTPGYAPVDAHRHQEHEPSGVVATPAEATTINDPEFVRKEEAKELIEILTGEDGGVATNKLKIVSVVGLGGLGKTTLAKVVYDRLKCNFHCSAFVSLSQNPDMKRVFKDMILQLHYEEYTDLLDERELIWKLRKVLRDKRYLIVIDDIWDTDSWKIMRCVLLDSNCGSRIITTTRLTNVGITADNVYKLQPLSPDESRILSFDHSSLPISLKTCLLYLATSGKNQGIERGSFVRKWIAEGFISEDGRYSREEVANRYFHELVNRSMIRPVGHDDSLGEVTYEVKYGLFDDLRFISEQEHFVSFLPKDGISNTSVIAPVRLFIQFAYSESYTGTQKIDLSRVRSVTMFGPAPADVVSLKHLEYLRVLDLDGYKVLDNSAMDDICRMIQLKYLSLKQTQVSELPSQIRKLVHLETLDVRQTPVKELPHEVVLLPRLEHLLFGQTSSPGGVKLPDGSNQLTSVKVLGVVDSRECSASVMEEISELKQLREVALVLHDGPADKELNDKLLSSICKCGNLRLVEIYGDSSSTSDKLPALPHLPLLEELKVVGTLVKLPRWIAQLRAIEKLEMRVCKLEPNDLIILGGLPGLKTLALALVGIPTEQVSITSGSGFPWLEVFTFDCAVPWIVFENGAMPRLTHLQLKLYVYPADKSPSGLRCLKSLNKVTLHYSSRYASADGVANTVAIISEEASGHGNFIELSINGDHENYFLSKSMSKVDKGITATHVETRVPSPKKKVDTRVSMQQITESEIEEEQLLSVG